MRDVHPERGAARGSAGGSERAAGAGRGRNGRKGCAAMEAVPRRGAELRNGGMGREEELGAPGAASRAGWVAFEAREGTV